MDCNSDAVQAYHNHIGIDKCSRPPISPGPGEIPPPPPLLSGPGYAHFLFYSDRLHLGLYVNFMYIQEVLIVNMR